VHPERRASAVVGTTLREVRRSFPAGAPVNPTRRQAKLEYTEHINPDSIAEAIDAQKMNEQLKRMANEKYPDSVDAVISERSDVSSDGSLITVTGQAIQFESSVDREALHYLNDDLVASPRSD
jgi:hypothetical protein